MYKLSTNIKIFSFSLIVLGLLGIGYGFYSAPKTIEESKQMVANYHDDSHSSSDSHSSESDSSESYGYNTHSSDSHVMTHDEHVYHQLANRPWAALQKLIFLNLLSTLVLGLALMKLKVVFHKLHEIHSQEIFLP